MGEMIPEKYFLVRGVGHGLNEVEAFEMALRDAGIEFLNLVPVSSILPRGAVRVSPEEGDLRPGEVTFCVMARKVFRAGEGSASVAVARGDTPYGYFVELTRDDGGAEREALETARRLFRSRFGVEPELEAVSATATADGVTCVLACAVLLRDRRD